MVATSGSSSSTTTCGLTTDHSKPSDLNDEATMDTAEAEIYLQQENVSNNEGVSAPIVLPEIMDYESLKDSDAYRSSKCLMSSGDFEDALQIVESVLKAALSSDQVKGDQLHESLAPLYYLYGTTLLYSVEESDNGLAVQQQDEEGGDADIPSDDLEIVWENLDVARSILERITTTDDLAGASKDSNPMGMNRAIDLAQVNLRLGDLQKANGRNSQAIEDYINALKIRKNIFGQFDRRVADCHYNLGMTYLHLATEVPSDVNDPIKIEELQLKKNEYTNISNQHYLSCGRSLAGVLGKLCNVTDSNSLITIETKIDIDPTCAGNGKGKGKSSSATKDCTDGPTEETALTSSAIRRIRENVALLTAHQDPDKGAVSEIKEILDELQETIDEASSEVKVLQEVSALKKTAHDDILASDKVSSSFDPTSAKTPVPGSTVIGFGTSSNVSTSITNQPTMMIKKKKKKPDSIDENKNIPDDANPIKRLKEN